LHSLCSFNSICFRNKFVIPITFYERCIPTWSIFDYNLSRLSFMISQTSMTGKRPSSSLRYHDGYRPSKIHRNRCFLGGADEPAALRKGKWSLEEEALAEQMIRDFFNHNLLDCQEGASLRSYLADKLSSSKMRISKKFAHRNIGSVSDIFTSLDVRELCFHKFIYSGIFI
jgi:hypothetical protein